MRPERARAASMGELARALASEPRGLCLLAGAEHGPAGLDSAALGARGPLGPAMSFCLGGRTYTAFGGGEGGGARAGSMALLAAREGNWCSALLEPAALLPRFSNGELGPSGIAWDSARSAPEDAALMILLHPATGRQVLGVGSIRSSAGSTRFVAHCDAPGIESAAKLGIALAWDLDGLPDPKAKGAPRRI